MLLRSNASTGARQCGRALAACGPALPRRCAAHAGALAARGGEPSASGRQAARALGDAGAAWAARRRHSLVPRASSDSSGSSSSPPSSPPSAAAFSTAAANPAVVEPIPSDLRIEVKPEDGSSSVEYDEANKVVRIPLSAMGPEGQRRSKLVLFTCNKCGGRTARLVNPVAWEKGVVFGQCAKCGVWHVLQARNKKIFEEVRYKEDPEYADDGDKASEPGAQAGGGLGAQQQQQQQQQ